MNIQDFEKALHSPCLKKWFEDNVDKLIRGKNNGGFASRENAITSEIVNCMNNSNIKTQRKGRRDIIDSNTDDIGEAAHNGTWQASTAGLGHIFGDYYKRLGDNHTEDKKDVDFYGLMYLWDLENVPEKTGFPYENDFRKVPRSFLIQSKLLTETTLNRFPGGIRVHEPFHNLQSSIESTILNYDIYVIKMKLNEQTAIELFKEFKNDDFIKDQQFPEYLLDI
jgi:hypothetical protein